MWVVAARNDTSTSNGMETVLMRLMPNTTDLTWSVAHILPMVAAPVAFDNRVALAIAELSGTLFLGSDSETVTTVTWVPPSTTPSSKNASSGTGMLDFLSAEYYLSCILPWPRAL
jgi:hypothetical protein